MKDPDTMMINFPIPRWIKASEKDLKPFNPPLPKWFLDDLLENDHLLAQGPFVVEIPYANRPPFLAENLTVDSNPESRNIYFDLNQSHNRSITVKGSMVMDGDALTFSVGNGKGRFRPIKPEDAEWIIGDGTKYAPISKIIDHLYRKPSIEEE